MLPTSNVKTGDIILMSGPVLYVFVSILIFFHASKESLLPCFKILHCDDSCSCENDFIIVSAEIEDTLIPIARVSVDMIDFIGHVWNIKINFCVFWYFFLNLFQEGLFISILLRSLFHHFYFMRRYLFILK